MKFTREFIALAERHNTTPTELHSRLGGNDHEVFFASLTRQLTPQPRSTYIEDLFVRYFND